MRRVGALLLVLHTAMRWCSCSPLPYDPELNIKSFYWDITCIHGLAPGQFSPNPYVTVYPVALGLAATWDVPLVTRVSQATGKPSTLVSLMHAKLTLPSSRSAGGPRGKPDQL